MENSKLEEKEIYEVDSKKYTVITRVSENCLGKEINGKILNDSMEFCASLLENEKLAVIPGKAFGLNNYIRVSYATSMEAIKEGLNRIESFIKKLN